MEMAITIVFAFAVGVLLGWMSNQKQVHSAEQRAETAEDRLYQSWKDGNTIPLRPVEEKEVELVPLHDTLRRIVNEWEDPETRESLESAFRAQMAEGFGPGAILSQYLDGHFEASPPTVVT